MTIDEIFKLLKQADPASVGAFSPIVKRFQILVVEKALEATKGNVAQAARLLGMERTALFMKMKAYKIENPWRDGV